MLDAKASFIVSAFPITLMTIFAGLICTIETLKFKRELRKLQGGDPLGHANPIPVAQRTAWWQGRFQENRRALAVCAPLGIGIYSSLTILIGAMWYKQRQALHVYKRCKNATKIKQLLEKSEKA